MTIKDNWLGNDWPTPPKPSASESELVIARRIAADNSKQTGLNYQAFIDGRYDHAYGVRTALEALTYGRAYR